MHTKLMILGFLLCFILSGCNGATNTDEVAYVVALGVDRSKTEGMIDVSYQIALPKAGGDGGGQSKQAETITLTAASLAEARNLLNSVVSLKPSLGHIKVLLVSEELARNVGVQEILGPIMRFREFRGSMFVGVVRGSTREFLVENKPIFMSSPSKYYDIMFESSDQSSYFLRSSLHNFYLRLKSHSSQPYMAILATPSGEGEPTGNKQPAQKSEAYIAGDLPRQGGNRVEFAGTAIFCGARMVDTLDTTETRCLAMLLNDFPQGFMVVKDPLAPQHNVSAKMRMGKSPDITVRIQDDIPIITIKMLLEGEVTGMASGINYEFKPYTELLEAQFAQVIQEQTINMIQRTQNMKTDVVGFGFYARSQFKLYNEFKDYHWDDQYQNAQVNVKVDVKLRRNGLMWRTAPIVGGDKQ